MRTYALMGIVLACMIIPNEIYGQGCMDAGSEEGVSVVGFLQSQFEYQCG